MPHKLTCTNCDHPMPIDLLRGADLQCRGCATALEVIPFPALIRDAESGVVPARIMADEASCFYHESRQAEAACDACGRFICSLCDMQMDSDHICPSCLSAGRKAGSRDELKNTHFCPDRVILLVAGLPMLFFFVTIFTAPLTLGMLIYYRNHPPSPVRGAGGWRKGLAFCLAILQLGFWAIFFFGGIMGGF